MKVLILSCGTGEGHNSAALAIKEELEKRKIDCILKDALSFGNHKAEKIVKSFFNNVAVKTPSLFGIMYKAGSTVSNAYLKSPIYFANLVYANNMLEYINSNGIDTIVCTHLFPMEAITYLKRIKKLKAKTYSILTDYTAIPFIEETRLDYYFIPDSSLVKEFEKKKIPKSKIIVTGVPVSSKFRYKYDKKECREKLGLPLKEKIILIMTGGVGCGNVIGIINELINKVDNDTVIVALAGKNKELKSDISACFNSEKVIPVGFTNKVELYMDASDLLLSKPGGLSSTEAAVKRIPLIHTMPIPGCETINASLFEKKGMSLVAKDIDEVVSKTVYLLNNDKKRELIIRNQIKNISFDASKKICDFIILKK